MRPFTDPIKGNRTVKDRDGTMTGPVLIFTAPEGSGEAPWPFRVLICDAHGQLQWADIDELTVDFRYDPKSHEWYDLADGPPVAGEGEGE